MKCNYFIWLNFVILFLVLGCPDQNLQNSYQLEEFVDINQMEYKTDHGLECDETCIIYAENNNLEIEDCNNLQDISGECLEYYKNVKTSISKEGGSFSIYTSERYQEKEFKQLNCNEIISIDFLKSFPELRAMDIKPEYKPTTGTNYCRLGLHQEKTSDFDDVVMRGIRLKPILELMEIRVSNHEDDRYLKNHYDYIVSDAIGIDAPQENIGIGEDEGFMRFEEFMKHGISYGFPPLYATLNYGYSVQVVMRFNQCTSTFKLTFTKPDRYLIAQSFILSPGQDKSFNASYKEHTVTINGVRETEIKMERFSAIHRMIIEYTIQPGNIKGEWINIDNDAVLNSVKGTLFDLDSNGNSETSLRGVVIEDNPVDFAERMGKVIPSNSGYWHVQLSQSENAKVREQTDYITEAEKDNLKNIARTISKEILNKSVCE